MVIEPQKVLRVQQTRSQHQRRALLFTCGHGMDVWGKSQRDFPTVAFRAFYKGGCRCVLGEPAGFLASSLSNVSPFLSQLSSLPVTKMACFVLLLLTGRERPARLLSRLQASRWLEFTVPRQHFAVPHEAHERTPDHHLSSF